MDEHKQSILDEIKKPDVRWITMTSKFAGICKECNGEINQGDSILWNKEKGAKHETCPTQLSEDFGGIVVDDGNDKPKTWRDPKEYSYKESLDIKNCQCCGGDVIKESYIDNGRKVCVNCWGS